MKNVKALLNKQIFEIVDYIFDLKRVDIAEKTSIHKLEQQEQILKKELNLKNTELLNYHTIEKQKTDIIEQLLNQNEIFNNNGSLLKIIKILKENKL